MIVIGLGAMGSASLYQLARRSVRVIGIDRHAPPHDLGSSHGETRITRQAIGEGDAYVPLVLRSHAIWRELEGETGEQLLLTCGFAAIDSSGDAPLAGREAGFVDRTVAVARRFGIAHELPGATEMVRRYPAMRLPAHAQVYFEPGGGLVYPERCIAAQLQRARAMGARVHTHETVTAIEPGPRAVRVTSTAGVYEAGQVIITAGGWTPGLVGAPLSGMRLLRQVLHWFTPDNPALYQAGAFPTFIWTHGPHEEDGFYGFPIAPGMTQAVKLATEQYTRAIRAPEEMAHGVGADEAAAMHARHADGRLIGLARIALRSKACAYTNAPDGDFVVDRSPTSERLLIVSACSGHGFKHSAGMGEHVARLIAGEDTPRPAFALGRGALARG